MAGFGWQRCVGRPKLIVTASSAVEPLTVSFPSNSSNISECPRNQSVPTDSPQPNYGKQDAFIHSETGSSHGAVANSSEWRKLSEAKSVEVESADVVLLRLRHPARKPVIPS